MSDLHPEIEQQIQDVYAEAPELAKESLCAALEWAKAKLRAHEGGGHVFNILPYQGHYRAEVVCEFSKPAWSGSHVGRPMGTGAEAIVMSVCEYLCGS